MKHDIRTPYPKGRQCPVYPYNAKKKNGFSLIELLLATVILAVFGLVVLQVFLFAEKQNKMAARLDGAVNACVMAVEQIKSDGSETLWTKALLEERFFEADVTEEGDGYAVSQLFNEQWDIMLTPDVGEKYRLNMVLLPDPETNGLTTAVYVLMKDINDADTDIYQLKSVLPSRCVAMEEEP